MSETTAIAGQTDRHSRHVVVAESQERQALRRALEWAKIAANNLNSGGKVLHAHGWAPEVNPFTGAGQEILNLINELESQIRRFDQ